MSKIEEALNRARENGLQVVPLAEAERGAAGTAVVTARRAGNAETILHMADREVRMLEPMELEERGIIRPQRGDDPAVQAIRAVRTRIIQQSHGENAVALITSVSKGCGGSFIARNLAAAFAFDAYKTALLMDCNLGDPAVHKLLGGQDVLGLADYLENPSLEANDIIHPCGIARCRLIPAGRSSDTSEELLSSSRLKLLLEAVRARYQERFVILDGPPMTKIADIRVLSELADFVVVVAGYGRSTNAQITSCLNLLGDKKLLALVFNEEPRIPRIH